jgi:hypothetical protein
MRVFVVSALLLFLPAAPAAAETLVFDVTLAGLRVATLRLETEEDGRRYAVLGRIATTGAAGALRPVRFDATAEGSLKGNLPRPSAYAGEVDTGRRQSAARLVWTGGAPLAEDGASGPKGAVDPLSALFAGLRDRGDPCDLALTVFDGEREARVEVAEAAADTGVSCRGTYTRVAGYPPEDLARRRRFDFTARFEPLPDGRFRLVEMVTDTAFGQAVLRRR